MKPRLLSTFTPAPPGFEGRRPERRDLLGGPLALLLADAGEIDTVIGPLRERMRGVLIIPGPQSPPHPVGPQLWQLSLPAERFDVLAVLLQPLLEQLLLQQAEEDAHNQSRIREQRLQRELDITNRDYHKVTDKLRRQVDELTATEAQLSASARELRDLNQELEARVQARTLELADAKEQAEAANAAKTFFLATMSHEVRTPMNGVIGLLDILQHGALDEEQHQLLDTAQDCAHVLLNLLDDILDFSKIEAGRVELELIPVNLRELLERVQEALASNAHHKQLQLSCRVDSRLPEWLLTDPLRLRQILLNLGSNAVKFTEGSTGHPGQVELSVEVLGCDDASAELMLRVRDNGIGMSAGVRERLFAAFSQGESSTSRRFGGTGLGLAISKRLTELMGGQIGVESEPGQGSLFWVRLPLHRARVQPGLESLPAVPAVQRPMHLLVVDDNPTNRLVAAKMLEKLGHRVEMSCDGEAALSLLASRRFDLVLMDCQMPTLDGFQATQRLRAQEVACGLPYQPVVAMTAGVLPDERRRCFEAGMDDFLSKPIQLNTVAALLERWSSQLPATLALPSGTKPQTSR